MKEYKAYINGVFLNSEKKLEIINPKTGEIAGTVPSLNKEDINKAFTIARSKYGEWRKTALIDRIEMFKNLNCLLLKNKNQLAKIMEDEIAKPFNDGVVEVERTVEYISKTISQWDSLKYSSITIGNKKANLNRIPIGVVLAISPFNYPINLSLSKIAPALLTGNTVVFKPATNGSLSGAFLAQMIHKAGFPNGVFNLVTGRGREIGDILTSHKYISMISFTGSVRVGKEIAKNQAMIPLVLEMGGNDAAYIRFDANLELAAKEVAKGAFSYTGQRCTAIKRLILHKDIKDEFLNILVNETKLMKAGVLVTNKAIKYVEELILDSKNNGDKFIISGDTKNKVIPFHIVETNINSRAWNEEAFGPLLPVLTIEDEDDLVDIYNNTNYGLQNSIFTADIEWAKKFSLDLESGTVNINKSSSRGPDIFPFLGVKDSGFGIQGIKNALISMTRILNIVENK